MIETVTNNKDIEIGLEGWMIDSAIRRVENGWNNEMILGIRDSENSVAMFIPTRIPSGRVFSTDQFYAALVKKYGHLTGEYSDGDISFVLMAKFEGKEKFRWTTLGRTCYLLSWLNIERSVDASFPFISPERDKKLVLKLHKASGGWERWSIQKAETEKGLKK